GPCRTSHPAVPHLPHPGHPHPRRAQAPAQLPTRLALDQPHPGDLPTPVRATGPDLDPAPPSDRQHYPRLEHRAHRGDTRHYRHATTRKPHLRHDQSSTHINMSKIVKRQGITADLLYYNYTAPVKGALSSVGSRAMATARQHVRRGVEGSVIRQQTASQS